MAKRHERTHARRCALQVLYTSEIQGAYPSVVASSERFLSEDGDLPDYAQKLIEGVEAHQIEIDRMLTSTSENWALARMPIVDRSILRLATFEMAYMDDVPVSVTIHEAVELAKDFGGEDESPRFVNGVLGRIAVQLEERTQAANEEGAQVGDAPADANVQATDAPADASAPADEGALADASAPAGEDARDAGPADARACELGAVEGERA